jgi:hypothetical protein
MEPAASLSPVSRDASWRISRDGDVVALVDVRHEGGSVVVSAGPAGGPKPYSFASLQAADAFTSDLLASFAYLGCEVAKA